MNASPTPIAIRSLRASAGITQAASAELVYVAWRTWAQWEAGDRRMPRATAELYAVALVCAGRVPLSDVAGFVRPEILARVETKV